MKKIVKLVGALLAALLLLSAVQGIWDRFTLRENLIRLHVVANSDSAQDQKLKLQVRDAVIGYLETQLSRDMTVHEATDAITKHLQELEYEARSTLRDNGCWEDVRVTLQQEAFSKREYDTFSLPSGIYRSLRITIGAGNGRNWWCVAFPALCSGTSVDEFQEIAVGAGLPEELTKTVSEGRYEIRFFFLDCLGKLENLFHLD